MVKPFNYSSDTIYMTSERINLKTVSVNGFAWFDLWILTMCDLSPFNEIKKNRVEIGDIEMVAYTKIESWFPNKNEWCC